MKKLLLSFLVLFLWAASSFGQTIIIGTGTSTTNGSTVDPVERYYNYEHFQMLYTAAELSAAGLPSGAVITGLGFSISESAVSLANYTIDMALTTLTLPPVTTGLVNVKPAFTYTPVVQAAGSFDMIPFTTNFTWDGTSNIVVNTCTGSNPFTSPYGGLRYSTTATYVTKYLRTDGSSNCATAVSGTTYYRPNIQFSYTPGSGCSGTPNPGNTLASLNPVCSGVSFTLSLQNATSGSGVTYQWKFSTDGTNYSDFGSGSSAQTASQTEATYYKCLVTCTNSGYSATSNPVYVTMNPFYACYCSSMAAYTADEEIYSVTVNGVLNAYNCTTVAPGPGSILNRYSNFQTLGSLTNLSRTTSVPFIVEENECDGATYYSNGCAIWIDFNHDGDYLDAGEQVYSEATATVSPRNITGFLGIPVDAVLGVTGMRVTVAEGYYGATLTPCLAYSYGETEDYLVTITEAPACPPPGNLAAVTYGYQANLSWTENGTATLWDMEWGPTPFVPTGSPTPGYANLTSTSKTLLGLTPSTGYAYYVRANCGGSYSTWTGPFNFTTTVSCPAPTAPVASLITTTSATLDWTVHGLETQWTIHYGPAGYVNNSGVGYDSVVCTSTKPYPLVGLLPSTQYDYYIRACCGVGDYSTWTAKAQFTTLCDVITTLPWTEGFELMSTVGSKILPPCWGYENVAGTSGPYSSNTTGTYNGPHNGTHYIYTYYANTTWVFTPQFAMTMAAGTYDFSFYMMNKVVTSPIDFLMDVAYGPTNNSAGMTNVLASSIVCSNSAYVLFKYTFTVPADGNYFFGVKTTSATGTPWYISLDDFRLEPTPACPNPGNVAITGITDNSAYVGWTDATTVDIDYGPVGHVAGTGPGFVNGTSTNPQQITGLSAQTSYDVYVRHVCPGKSLSNWTGPVQFTTLCGALPLPWCEPFQQTVIPTCWTMSGPTGWLFTTTWPYYGAGGVMDHTGTGGSFAGVDGSYTGTQTGISLNSPLIDVSPLIHPSVSLWVFNNNISSVLLTDEQQLVITVYDGASAIASYTWDYGVNFSTWQNVIVPFVKPAGNKVTLKFVVNGNTGYPFYDDMIIDDVCVIEGPACPPPTSLQAAPSATSADVSWTSAASSFDVEFGPNGFIPTGSPTPGYGGVGNPTTLMGLSPATKYDYYVRADCGGGKALSTWAGPKTFTTLCNLASLPLCESFDGSSMPVCWTTQLAGAITSEHWFIANSNVAGGTPYEAEATYSPGQGAVVTDQDRMVSPAFNVSGISAITVMFNQMLNDYNAGINDVWIKVQYSSDGATWTDAWTYNAGLGVSIPASTLSLLIPTSGTKMYIAWTLAGYTYDINYWYVDNICIKEALAHDVGTVSIALPAVAPPTTPIIPTANVINYGSNPETFDVTMTISDGYVSTKTVTGLGVGLGTTVIFDSWTPALGPWTAQVCTHLAGDMDLTNDCKSQDVLVKNALKIYACVAYDPTSALPHGPAYFYDMSPGTITSLAAGVEANFMEAGAWVNGLWYASDYYDNTVSPPTGGGWYTIDPTTGVETLLASLGRSFTGIAWDRTNSIMYGVDYNGSSNDIFTIIPATGVATMLGTVLSGELLIDLAYTGDGYLYAVGIGGDALYKIDPVTLTTTNIGACGYDYNYAQGMGYDYGSSTMYLAAFNYTAGVGQLQTVSLTTGAATLIGNFQGGTEMDAVAIPYSSGKTLNLSQTFLEGLYAGEGAMFPSYNCDGLQYQADTADLITVELRNKDSYSTLEYGTTAALMTNGTATLAIPSDKSDLYWLTIKSRSSVETTSAATVDFSGAVINYAYNPNTQSYGPNMAVFIDGTAAFYTGDENQDGLVDGGDLSDIGNLADYAACGYVPQDLNGDGLLDGSDLSMCGNNADFAIGLVTP